MLKLLFFIVVFGLCIADEVDPVVCFKKGCVRGKTFKGSIREFEAFLGIPFAKAPIDGLRLKVSFAKFFLELHNKT